MQKFRYEVIAMEAEKLFNMYVFATMRNRFDLSSYYMELYCGFLEGCGWTNQEFDREMSIRVDKEWQRLYILCCKPHLNLN